MSDTQVSISFGGTTAEFEAACQRATAALQGLLAGVNGFSAGLASASQGLNTTTPAMQAFSQASTAAAASVQRTSTASKAASTDLQALINATTGVSRAQSSAADSANVFRQALGDQTNEVKALRTAFEETNTAAGHAAHGTGGVTRELLVLGHEAMMGNFSRFGGSLIVMAELVGNVSTKMIALGGAIALAGVAVYHLIENFIAARRDAEALNAEMALMGRDPIAATASAADLAKHLHEVDGLSETTARHVANTMTGMKDATAETSQQWAKLAVAIQTSQPDKKIEEITDELQKQASSFHGLIELVQKYNLLMGLKDRQDFAALQEANKLDAARDMVKDRLESRYGNQSEARKGAQADQRAFAATTNADGFGIGSEAPPQPPAAVRNTAPAEDPKQAALEDHITENTKSLREQAILTEQIAEQTKMLGVVSDETAAKEIQKSIEVDKAKLAQLRDAGDASWLQAQEAALQKSVEAAEQTQKTTKGITEARYQTEVDFWGKQLQGENLTAKQRTEIEQRLSHAKAALHAEEVREAEAANRAVVAGTRKTVQEQIAELSADQAANRDNFMAWMALEEQKKAVLRAAYGEKSKQFQDELRAEETYQREHSAKLERAELESIDRQNAVAQKALSERITNMETEVAEQKLSKDDELAQAKQITAAEAQIELQRLDTFIASLTEGTDEFRKAMEKRADLYQLFQNKLGTIDRQIATQNKIEQDRSSQAYVSAFERIGSEGERLATGLIAGTTTWQRAEQQAANAVLSGFISVTTQAVSRWAAMELANTDTTKVGDAARTAIQEGQSGGSVIAKLLAQWLGLETDKTAATATQTGVRSAVDATASKASAADALIAGAAQVRVNAAVAASAAYASTAAIPIVGPELAPEAAATAFAGASSYGASLAVPSFAVGAWQLPGNMLAQLHEGEMIVPSFEAGLLRQGGALGGGGSPSMNVNLQSLDSQSAMAVLQRHIPMLAQRLKQHWQLNPSSRPV